MATKATKKQRAILIKNLEARVADHDAPQSIIGSEFIAILLDLLLGLLEQCLGQNSKKRTAKRIRKLSPYRKSILRRKIKRELYDNSQRRYSGEGGDHVLHAAAQTAEDLSSNDANDLIDEIDDEAVDYGMF